MDMKTFIKDNKNEFKGGYEFGPDHAVSESGWYDGL